MATDTQERTEPGEARVEDSLERIVEEGGPRLHRTWPALLATGAVGGLDVATGVLALLAVYAASHDHLLAGVAFSIGLIALLLGHSELFTEGFLVPVTVVAAGRARLPDLVRLWAGVLIANLAGGWIITWLIMQAFPDLGTPAVEAGRHYIALGFTLHSFCLAVLGGSTITLMTRMQHGTSSDPAKLVAAVAGAFLLAGLQLFHSILDSLLVFGALHAGAPFGYADWLAWFWYTALLNMAGGLLVVTLLRLVRSKQMLEQERADARK
jgi:formate/nitrite transporter FocA (FNT family)